VVLEHTLLVWVWSWGCGLFSRLVGELSSLERRQEEQRSEMEGRVKQVEKMAHSRQQQLLQQLTSKSSEVGVVSLVESHRSNCVVTIQYSIGDLGLASAIVCGGVSFMVASACHYFSVCWNDFELVYRWEYLSIENKMYKMVHVKLYGEKLGMSTY